MLSPTCSDNKDSDRYTKGRGPSRCKTSEEKKKTITMVKAATEDFLYHPDECMLKGLYFRDERTAVTLQHVGRNGLYS